MNNMELVSALLNELVNESVDWYKEKIADISKATNERFSGPGVVFHCDFADLHDETQSVEKNFVFDDRGCLLGVYDERGFRILK